MLGGALHGLDLKEGQVRGEKQVGWLAGQGGWVDTIGRAWGVVPVWLDQLVSL